LFPHLSALPLRRSKRLPEFIHFAALVCAAFKTKFVRHIPILFKRSQYRMKSVKVSGL
jgi:hypothetical protein